MGFRIEIDRGRALVTLWVEGRFDLRSGFALYQYCAREKRGFRHYVIDLARVTDLRESGLSWLRMFTRWAGGRGIGVRIINTGLEHTERCRQWDIAVCTPGDPVVSLRLGGGESRLGPAPDVPLPETLERVQA